MPWFEVDGRSIYDWLHEPKFHALFFFDGKDQISESLGDLAEIIDVHSFPLYPNVVQIFGSSESLTIVLRPDNYIGLIAVGVSPEQVRNYLNHVSV
jgi:hypothetical protein